MGVLQAKKEEPNRKVGPVEIEYFLIRILVARWVLYLVLCDGRSFEVIVLRKRVHEEKRGVHLAI